MNDTPVLLLHLALVAYVAGVGSAILFFKADELANRFSFGCATAGALCGVMGGGLSLASGNVSGPFEVVHSLVPYLHFSVRLDALGVFFWLLISTVALAISIYSVGYARSFYGRKKVAVLGGF